jgi:prepilin-type N-terminal cleavage/methylation domain-containing protein
LINKLNLFSDIANILIRSIICHVFQYLNGGTAMKIKKATGFTMIELLLVLAITGTLLSMSTIGYAAYIRSTKLKGAIYIIDAEIRQTRLLAQCSAKACYIRFDVDSHTYTVNGKSNTKLPEGIRFGVAPGVTGCPGAPSTLPPSDGISFESSGHPNTLSYYPTGAVVPGGTIYLTDGKRTMAVRVARTGRPKLWLSVGEKAWVAM